MIELIVKKEIVFLVHVLKKNKIFNLTGAMQQICKNVMYSRSYFEKLQCPFFSRNRTRTMTHTDTLMLWHMTNASLENNVDWKLIAHDSLNCQVFKLNTRCNINIA